MKINIKNIGVIENSSIIIDGLTVITGSNNSGKSTTGKVLYSMFSAKEDLFENVTLDIINHTKVRSSDIIRNSGLSFFFRRHIRNNNENNGILYNVFNGVHPNITSIEDAVQYIVEICDEINRLNLDEIVEQYKLNLEHITKYKNSEAFKNDMSEVISEFEILMKHVEKIRNFDYYESRKIYKTLVKEFSGQISPVKKQDNYISEITIENQNDLYSINIDCKSKKTSYEGYFGFEDTSNVVFVDDITVLDNLNIGLTDFFDRMRRGGGRNDLMDNIFVLDHNYALIKKLATEKNIVESIISDEFVNMINDKISCAFDDDAIVRDGVFICAKDGLNLSNLAMGAKIFAIIKMLLSNGNINAKTLLILDEPESHLHPLWQNKLAELIVILIKYLKLKVVITSHSPNFVLALQTYAGKYGMIEQASFYSTKKKEDNYTIDYQLMNDDMTEVYADFARPFSEIKSQFDFINKGE